jgi:hypothetical protein
MNRQARLALEDQLTTVVNYFSEPLKDLEDFQDVRELIDQHGEYGVAYELLCYLIAEKQLGIPTDIYQKIVELGKQMGIEEKMWLSLADFREAS